MRTLIYILVCGLLFSCSNANDKEMMVATAEEAVGFEDTKMTSETFKYETITKQKLQEVFDLNTLANDYPNDSIIKNQLSSIAEYLDLSNIKKSQKIITIKALGRPKKVNDSIQILTVLFTTENLKGAILKDSVNAVITTKKFILEGEEQNGTKVVFTSILKKTQ